MELSLNASFLFLFALAAFLGGWLLVCFVSSRTSGWSELARSYRTSDGFPVKRITVAGPNPPIRMMAHSPTTTIKIGCDPHGIYLAKMPMFQWFHPPLFIPWRDIQDEWFHQRLGPLSARYIRLTFSKCPSRFVDLQDWTATELEVRSAGNWESRALVQTPTTPGDGAEINDLLIRYSRPIIILTGLFLLIVGAWQLFEECQSLGWQGIRLHSVGFVLFGFYLVRLGRGLQLLTPNKTLNRTHLRR